MTPSQGLVSVLQSPARCAAWGASTYPGCVGCTRSCAEVKELCAGCAMQEEWFGITG